MRIFLSQQNTEGFTPFESRLSVTVDNEVTPSPHIYNSRTGFTLVETLVAITILLLVIIGPMTIAQKGIQNAYYAREQLVAVSLAQEAIEGIRKLRDTKAIEIYTTGGSGDETTDSWMQTIDDSCLDGSGNCAYVGGSEALRSCYSEYCRLEYDSVNNTYAHSSVVGNSIYTRRITITSPVSGAVKVSADVGWTGKIFGGTTRHVVLQTWIYDHYRRYE